MIEDKDKQLDEQLAQLTRWDGEKTELWRDALEQDEEGATASRFSLKSFMSFRISTIAAAVIIIAATAATLQFAFGPGLITSGVAMRKSIQSTNEEMVPLASSSDAYVGGWDDADQSYASYDSLSDTDGGSGDVILDSSKSFRPGIGAGGGEIPSRRSRSGTSSRIVQIADGNELQPIDRQVIRKATIELRTDDVRATFLKAAQLISEANSEYTEASSLTGSGDKARANITLRVAVDRLSIVLNQLRKLGKVHSEDMRGEDVTSRVVDLDARLRNEKRIEKELLGLLDKRDDAPLKEIMVLRSSINEVRQSIEWLTAQKQRLSRLVSLATILVIIRAEDAPEEEPEPEPTLSEYFSDSVGTSWSGGLRFLSDTVAGLLRVIIGGIIWWVVIAIAIYSIMRSRRVEHLPTT